MDEKELHDAPSSPDEQQVFSRYIKPQARLIHDPNVTFEEYYYYAQKTREEEKALEAPNTDWKALLTMKKQPTDVADNSRKFSATDADFANKESRIGISDEEWTNASRAFRTAGWGACFYLVRFRRALHREHRSD